MEASPAPTGWRDWHDETEPIRLGVSACLLGENVRHDGGHARDRFVAGTLGQWVSWVPVCPEVESGMPVPRPTIRLVDDSGARRLVAPSTGEDFTDVMRDYAERRLDGLASTGLDGFVLKKGSPSCALARLPVYRNGTRGERNGTGLFAQALLARWPDLPVEEEGRLNDPRLRENFIERILCRNRWRLALRAGLDRGRLVAFHTAHKLLLRAHNEAGYRRLGKLVGSAGQLPQAELALRYGAAFQECLSTLPTTKRHTNVLQHALGYLKRDLDREAKAELLETVEDYRRGLVPLVVPLTLMRSAIRRHRPAYLLGQLYFDPHPKELMLRNHC